MIDHTKGPWRMLGGDEKRSLVGVARKKDGVLRFPLLIEVTGDNHEEDAEYILEACNHYMRAK